MQTLEKTTSAYSNHLQFRYENRYSPEKLEALDDKHLFVEEDLRLLAKEVGFRSVEIISPWRVSPPSNSNIWKEITIEVMEALRHEAGLEKLRIDYSKVLSLDSINGVIGSELLGRIPPQGIIVFQK